MSRSFALQTIGTSAFILTLAWSASAQEKPVMTTRDMADTVKVTVTGEVDLDYVWRRHEITAMTGGVGNANTPADSASENTFEGFVALRLTAELSDKITGTIEFGTKRVDAGVINYFASPSGAGSAALSLQLREANITIQELILPELKLQVGISTWSFDIRGKGQSLAFDPRHSQSFTRNVNAGPDTDTALLGRAGDYQELEPAGGWLRYGREKLVLDLVALPAVIEGGSPHNDEAFYAVDLLYKIDDKDSRFGLIASATSDPGGRSLIYTYGGGFDWKGANGFDVYAEIYFQNGWNSPGGPTPDLKVRAWAGQVGVEYMVPSDSKGWIGVNLTYFTGDDTLNGTSHAFTSYENIHDLLILEDMYLGFDWDSNYRAIKIAGGFAMNGGGKGNLKFSAILGICQTAKAVQYTAITTPENTHKLGNEADVKVDWEFSKQLTINLGVGYLFGSEVLEDALGGPGAPNAVKQTVLFTLGTDLKF
jgi:hypothetical protein